jgi:death-on-curing family protein
MGKMVKYPTIDRIVEYNLLALTIIKVKKADSPKVLSLTKLANILDDCRNLDGDIYEKATFIFKNLIKGHVFASGNRRTAFIVIKDFLEQNGGKFKIKDDPTQAKVMVGIREGYYTNDEIKEWIKHGKIKKFERFKR